MILAIYEDVEMVERWAGPYTCPTVAALLVLVFGVVFLVGYRREEKKKLAKHRLNQHLCIKCGYSLTGNTSGVCPECGADTKRNPDTISK